MNSWNKVAPRLAQRYRVLRYDQRGSGLSEKVRQEFSNDVLVEDFEALAKGLGLAPPYHFVTVAAAATQALRFLEKHPDQVGSLTLCNPAPGVDPSRAAALDERAAFAMREGMRASLPTTLDISYPKNPRRPRRIRRLSRPLSGQRSGGFRLWLPRAGAHQHAAHAATGPPAPPWWSPVATTPCARMPAARSLAKKIPGARFELIEAGHFMPTQGPEPLDRAARRFFTQTVARIERSEIRYTSRPRSRISRCSIRATKKASSMKVKANGIDINYQIDGPDGAP